MLKPFDLNWRHVLAVSATAARGSMSAAAEAVSLSQPALTQGLAKLEAQLETPLFVRRVDGMSPTAEGAVLAARAEAAFRHLAEAARGRSSGFAKAERLMTATQLRALLALADARGFSAAAEQTGLSQPAIHRSVRELEQIVGVPLAERRGRGVALTDHGRKLARGARLAAGEIAAAIADIRRDDPGAGPIVVGAMPLCRARLLPVTLARFLAEEARADISVVEGAWRDLVEPLRDGSIDIMIGALRTDPAPADLDQTPLVEDHLVVVGRAGHPLAGEPAPTPEALARYPWVIGPARSPLRRQWEILFGGGPVPSAPVTCGSVITIRGLLQETDFLTLLSPAQVALEVESGVLAQIGRPLTASRRTIGYATRADWRPTAAQMRFLAHLAQAALESAYQESE